LNQEIHILNKTQKIITKIQNIVDGASLMSYHPIFRPGSNPKIKPKTPSKRSKDEIAMVM